MGKAPVLFQQQGRWSESGRQEAVRGWGKEKAIVIPAGIREEREREKGEGEKEGRWEKERSTN